MLGKGSLVTTGSFSVHTVTPVLIGHPEVGIVILVLQGKLLFWGGGGGGAKKVFSDSPLPVDSVIGLVNSIFNSSNGEVKVFGFWLLVSVFILSHLYQEGTLRYIVILVLRGKLLFLGEGGRKESCV